MKEKVVTYESLEKECFSTFKGRSSNEKRTVIYLWSPSRGSVENIDKLGVVENAEIEYDPGRTAVIRKIDAKYYGPRCAILYCDPE